MRRNAWLELSMVVVAVALVMFWQARHGHNSLPDVWTEDCGLRLLGRNPKGFYEYENPKDGMVLVKITGGTFQMGSNSANEKPPHAVTLPPYFMGLTPVTNAQFALFERSTGYNAGSEWKKFASELGPQTPVVCVNWNDAMSYCTWAGLRLPTEEEWELAARGTEALVYPWGNTWDGTRCNNSVGLNFSPCATSIGLFPSGASPFDCLDMAGNVWQWTSSWYERYPGNMAFNRDFGRKFRVLRGGAWNDTHETAFCGSTRGRSSPSRTL